MKRVIVFFAPAAMSLLLRADDCGRWMKSIAGYEERVVEVTGDAEPQDHMAMLRRFSENLADGRKDRAEEIKETIEAQLRGLNEIIPLGDMEGFHSTFVRHLSNVVETMKAELDDDERARASYYRASWESLKTHFFVLAELLSEHGCNPGDIKAIEDDYIPRIDKILDTLENEETPE